MNGPVDITPIVQATIGLCAVLLSTLGSVALGYLIKKFHVQVAAQTQATWDDALRRAVSFGVQDCATIIKNKGWGHPDTHNAVVNTALWYIAQHMPGTLRSVGLTNDMNNAANTVKIKEALNRVLPEVFSALATSPATPPVPPPNLDAQVKAAIASAALPGKPVESNSFTIQVQP